MHPNGREEIKSNIQKIPVYERERKEKNRCTEIEQERTQPAYNESTKQDSLLFTHLIERESGEGQERGRM